MVKIWRNRIWAGTKMLSHCPDAYRQGVIDMMHNDIVDGSVYNIDKLQKLVDDGKMTEEEMAEIVGNMA